MKKINSVLDTVLKQVQPSKGDLEIIENAVKDFSTKLKSQIKKHKIKAEVFVGGSFAKKTVVKKDYYDVDVFLRFDKKYDDEISKISNKLLKNFKNVKKVHGSRDYFRIKVNEDLFVELIPVIKVENPKESLNITDLSYSHVKYINKKIKTKKILDDIKIAKVFCHANNCYGAESYVKGFSGYSLELLVYKYKGFLNFIKEMSKIKDKLIIDIEKQYKNKNQVMMDMNTSKLISPIILVDPTYQQRNALAGLSQETFEEFKKTCKKFLKNPSVSYFEKKKIDLKKISENAKKLKDEFIIIEISTNKQEGDIAGSKLLKFSKHLESEIGKYFQIKRKGFNYNMKKSARIFFVAKSKKEIILQGPFVEDKINSKKFRKEHKNIFEKKKKLYARKKITFGLEEFVKKWQLKNRKKIKEMSIKSLDKIA